MKYIAFLVNLLFSLAGYSQALEIKFKDCRNERQSCYLNSFSLFKGDSLIGSYHFEGNNRYNIERLDKGIYRIEYQSIFDKTESVQVEIAEAKSYADLCLNKLDYSKETYVPVIDRIKKRESYAVEIYSHGCFHHAYDTLVITRKGRKYFAFYNGKNKQLEQQQIEAIRHFELEMNCMQSGGMCTTNTFYEIKYRGIIVAKLDDKGCSWAGEYYLLMALGWNTY